MRNTNTTGYFIQSSALTDARSEIKALPQYLSRTHKKIHHFPPTAAGFMSCCASGRVATLSSKNQWPHLFFLARHCSVSHFYCSLSCPQGEKALRWWWDVKGSARDQTSAAKICRWQRRQKAASPTTECLGFSRFLGKAHDLKLHVPRSRKFETFEKAIFVASTTPVHQQHTVIRECFNITLSVREKKENKEQKNTETFSLLVRLYRLWSFLIKFRLDYV